MKHERNVFIKPL